MFVNAQGNLVKGDSDVANARATDPPGSTCTFCGKENDNADDCGWWYLYPNGKADDGGYACNACFDGEPGKKHQAIYGIGER